VNQKLLLHEDNMVPAEHRIVLNVQEVLIIGRQMRMGGHEILI
jgi:hypothetical protein